MASLLLTVCLAPGFTDVDDAIGEAMGPFEMGQDFSMDRSIWDRRRIVLGENLFFPVRPGSDGDERLIYPAGEAAEPGRCAGGPVDLIDFERRRRLAETSAGGLWDEWQTLAKQHPPALPLDTFLGRLPTQEAVTAHRNQPLIQAIAGSAIAPDIAVRYGTGLGVVDGIDELLRKQAAVMNGTLDAVTDFGAPRQEFVAWHGEKARWISSLLTVDGWWCEPGQLPVHGACESLAACPHTADVPDCSRDLTPYLSGLPSGTVIVAMMCHV